MHWRRFHMTFRCYLSASPDIYSVTQKYNSAELARIQHAPHIQAAQSHWVDHQGASVPCLAPEQSVHMLMREPNGLMCMAKEADFRLPSTASLLYPPNRAAKAHEGKKPVISPQNRCSLCVIQQLKNPNENLSIFCEIHAK